MTGVQTCALPICLLHATPRAWLEDGKIIRLEQAPTAFGTVSCTVKSELKAGRVIVDVSLPARHPPTRSRLRLRLPDGWRATYASLADGTSLPLDAAGTADLSRLRENQTITFLVAPR